MIGSKMRKLAKKILHMVIIRQEHGQCTANFRTGLLNSGRLFARRDVPHGAACPIDGNATKMNQARRDTLKTLAGAVSGSLLANTGKSQARADTPRRRIKIGQIGTGHAHASKLGVYRKSDDYEVVGLVEPDPELRRRAERQEPFRGVPLMTQEQLLGVPGLEAVLVETRVRDLLRTAEACVNAGKHVHIDKPAGESLPQLKRILANASMQGLTVQMGYMYRYNPGFLLLREFLNSGWLGEVFEVETVMSKVIEPARRPELAMYRGGMFFELGCHVLDLVIGILGRPQEIRPFIRHSSPLRDTLKDNALAVLEYPRVTATIRASGLEVNGEARRHLTVCGTQGTFHIQPLDNPSAMITLSQARAKYKKGSQVITFPKFTRYVADAADMAKIIRREKKSDYSAEHDLTVQETLLRACALPVDE